MVSNNWEQVHFILQPGDHSSQQNQDNVSSLFGGSWWRSWSTPCKTVVSVQPSLRCLLPLTSGDVLLLDILLVLSQASLCHEDSVVSGPLLLFSEQARSLLMLFLKEYIKFWIFITALAEECGFALIYSAEWIEGDGFHTCLQGPTLLPLAIWVICLYSLCLSFAPLVCFWPSEVMWKVVSLHPFGWKDNFLLHVSSCVDSIAHLLWLVNPLPFIGCNSG